jgi:hypothetical protein
MARQLVEFILLSKSAFIQLDHNSAAPEGDEVRVLGDDSVAQLHNAEVSELGICLVGSYNEVHPRLLQGGDPVPNHFRGHVDRAGKYSVGPGLVACKSRGVYITHIEKGF